MRQLADKIQFIQGRLNSDVDIEMMPKGDSPVDPSLQDSGRLNLAHLDGNLGALSSIKGTSLMTGLGNILAGKYDAENNAVIFLVYGSVYNRITRLNNDNTYTEIYSDQSGLGQPLNFSADEVIRNIEIIGSGDDAQLCWTSDRNPPRCINMSRIMANPSATPISLALDAPDTIPSLALGSDTSVRSNNMYNKGYQFAVKYIYFDGKESSWSDWTEPFFPARQYESFNGMKNPDILSYNRITLTHSLISASVGIKEVYIAYRYVDIGSGVPGAWYLYDIVTVSGSSVTYHFYDNKNRSAIGPSEILRQGYDVPLNATDLLISKDNKIILANPTMGYDNVAINVGFETLFISSFLWSQAIQDDAIAEGSYEDISLLLVANTSLVILFSSVSSPSESFSVTLNIGNITDDYSYQVVKYAGDYPINLTVTRVSSNVIRVASAGGVPGSVAQNVVRNSFLRDRSQKSGAIRYLAIAYEYDKGRKGRANITPTSFISVPFWPDLHSSIIYTYYRLAIGYEIIHTPPSGATRWELLDGGSNLAAYYQIMMICSSDQASVTKDIAFVGGYITLDVNAADNRILAANRNYSTLITFDAAKGDRVRFKAKGTRGGSPPEISECTDVFTNNIDLEIIDVDANGVLTVEANVANSELAHIIGDGMYDIILIEVYRVSKDISADNLNYVSTGVKGAVSGGYHQHVSEPGIWSKNSDGTTFTPRNQTASLSCRGIAVIGDYAMAANMYDMGSDASPQQISVIIAIIEANRMSLSYGSVYQGGKFNYVDSGASQRTIRGLVPGGTYSEDGFVFNELNKFDEADITDLTDSYGDICAIELIGHTIKVFQRSKITAVGNLVNENFNADGTSYQVSISETLGEPRQLGSGYGTVFPRSVVPKDSYVYFYDIHNFCPVRNAPNGNQEITYGMSNFWKARSKALLVSGIDNIDVHAVYDYILDMYIITVKDGVTAANSFTLGFCEANSRWGNALPGWYSFFGFMPDGYVNMSRNRIFAYILNNLYEHHVSGTRNNFYGTQYASYITIVSNEAPGVMKVFESIHINSNSSGWGSPNNDDIIIHEDGGTYTDQEGHTRHKIKMQSRLKSGLFKFIEGLFKADYLRNIITSSTTPKQSDLYKGDVLRGRYLKQTLRNTATTEVHLRDVTVNSSASKGN